MERLTTVQLREKNRNRIFRYIHSSTEPVTKQSIATALNVSLPTVTQNLKELMEQNLVQWGEALDSTGGRKPKEISVVASSRIAIGLNMTKRRLQLSAVNLNAQVVSSRQAPLPFAPTALYFSHLLEEIERFTARLDVPPENILGVGIAVPGLVDADTHRIIQSPELKLRDYSYDKLLQVCPYPIHLENDASAGGRAEAWHFHKEQTSFTAYLALASGVGGCLLPDGVSSYEGRNHQAAEFGHMTLLPGGRLCTCGQKGCVEAYCSTDRLSVDLGCTLDDFFRELTRGNATYREVWDKYLKHLALEVHNLSMALDCTILLGGALAPYLPPYLPELERRVRVLDPFGKHNHTIAVSPLGDKAPPLGAALRYIQHFIETV